MEISGSDKLRAVEALLDENTFLIPCPSCDNRHPMIVGAEATGDRSRVVCGACGLQTAVHETAAEAAERWNTRPEKTLVTLEKQLVGLRVMIDMGLSWEDVLVPLEKNEGH